MLKRLNPLWAYELDEWAGCDFRRWCYGGKGGDAPPPPDPAATAAAQGAANAETARVQGRLNRPDEYTPFGTRIYTDLGNDRFRTDITLSPEQQRIYDSQTGITQGLYDLAGEQLPRLRSALGSDLDLSGLPQVNEMSGDALSQSMYDRLLSRIQPQMDRRREDTYQMLADRGIGLGNEGASRTLSDLGQTENDALRDISLDADRNRAAEMARLLSQRQAGIQERAYMRDTPLRDIASLMGTGGGPQMPQFSPMAGVGVAPTDVIGPTYQSYQGQLANWQNQQRQDQQLMGGLFSLGSAALGGWAGGGFPMFGGFGGKW